MRIVFKKEKVKDSGGFMEGIKKRIQLWEGEAPFWDETIVNEENLDTATVTPYLIEDGEVHGCVLVCPGGGYVKRTRHEGEEVAEYLNAAGLHAFVVNYRVAPYRPEIGIIDAMRAVKYVRYYAERFHIIPGQIGIMGFSAGGGIACYTSLGHRAEEYPHLDEIDQMGSRPDTCCLCYAALSLRKERLNEKDYNNFRQVFNSEAAYEKYLLENSCEYLVDENMPPVFLWHTAEDIRVPVGGSMDFSMALKEKEIPFELHIFNEGVHGLGVTRAMEIDGTKQWFSLYLDWLKRQELGLK